MEVKIDTDTADGAHDEDQDFDTLNEATDALSDDEGLADEHTDESEEESSDEDEGNDAESDFEDSDSVSVTLGDGEQVQLGELKKGYFRNKDYTHKTEALAQERKSVDAQRESYSQNAQLIQNVYHSLAQFLESALPPEPNIGLLQSDPNQYQYQQAVRNAAIAELQTAYDASQQATSTIQSVNADELARVRSTEDAKLLAAMPMLKEPGRRAVFDATNKKTALDFGFSDQDVGATTDHRILQLVHYARLGKIAEQNRKNAERRIAEKPRKGTRSKPAVGVPTKNREAMRRLQETGSLEAAMGVDFD